MTRLKNQAARRRLGRRIRNEARLAREGQPTVPKRITCAFTQVWAALRETWRQIYETYRFVTRAIVAFEEAYKAKGGAQ